MPLAFEWDHAKASTNLKKHSVSFTEAASVLSDPQARIFLDEDHSIEEAREIVVGYSIAKRCATKRELRDYEEYGTI